MEDVKKESLLRLFEELANSKKEQRKIEEQLLDRFRKPLYKKWMQERITDQHKHEKMLIEMAETGLHKELVLKRSSEGQVKVHQSPLYELERQLEKVSSNIQFISNTSQSIEDFRIYKMMNAMLTDEYIYQFRLIMMIKD